MLRRHSNQETYAATTVEWRISTYGTDSLHGTVTLASGSAILRDVEQHLDSGKVVGTADWFSEGVRCHMLKSLQRDMGLENATKKGQVKEFCCRKFTTTELVSGRMGQCVREGRAGHQDRVSDCRTQQHTLGWHLFDKSNLTLGRQERLPRAAEVECDFAAMEYALLSFFPETIICQEERSFSNRRPYPAADRRSRDRQRNRFDKRRDGRRRTRVLKSPT